MADEEAFAICECVRDVIVIYFYQRVKRYNYFSFYV